MIKKIKLTQGKYALIDEADHERLNQYRWYFAGDGYAGRQVRREDGKQRLVLMHREIMGFPDKKVDHMNRNRLDNRRANLRTVTDQENSLNHSGWSNRKALHKGVYWLDSHKAYAVKFSVDRKQKFFGYFKNVHEAIKTYNENIVKYRGELSA